MVKEAEFQSYGVLDAVWTWTRHLSSLSFHFTSTENRNKISFMLNTLCGEYCSSFSKGSKRKMTRNRQQIGKSLNNELENKRMREKQQQKERRKVRRERTQTLYVRDFPSKQECGSPRPPIVVEIQAPARISFVTTTKFHQCPRGFSPLIYQIQVRDEMIESHLPDSWVSLI